MKNYCEKNMRRKKDNKERLPHSLNKGTSSGKWTEGEENLEWQRQTQEDDKKSTRDTGNKNIRERKLKTQIRHIHVRYCNVTYGNHLAYWEEDKYSGDDTSEKRCVWNKWKKSYWESNKNHKECHAWSSSYCTFGRHYLSVMPRKEMAVLLQANLNRNISPKQWFSTLNAHWNPARELVPELTPRNLYWIGLDAIEVFGIFKVPQVVLACSPSGEQSP